jgi:signal transduction histidine kinase
MKLTFKLTLAFLLVSLIAAGLAAMLIWGKISNEFNRYLEDQRQNSFVVAVTTYYQSNHAWEGVDAYLRQQELLPPLEETDPPPQPFVLVDQDRAVVVASAPYQVGEKVKKGEMGKGIPIEIDGQVVGTVISTGQPLVRRPIDQKYVDQINQALWIAGLSGVLIALFLGILIARSLTRPVRELTDATRSMARGELNQQVPVRSADELGELATAFNQMSTDLARANQSRRQMTADIAHDLRNPLTVIGGYLESLKDGKLKATPERFEIMLSEVHQLQRLVDDLRTLSLADAGELAIHKQPVSAEELLERVAAAYQPHADDQNITLALEVPPGLPEILADPERIEQVLGNLLSNALRYTPQGGKIRLGAYQQDSSLVLSVQDNGSGIPPEILPDIFERSFRGDSSRSGAESGLGLAIAKSIVGLHGGSIQAESDGTGSKFSITLPVVQQP